MFMWLQHHFHLDFYNILKHLRISVNAAEGHLLNQKLIQYTVNLLQFIKHYGYSSICNADGQQREMLISPVLTSRSHTLKQPNLVTGVKVFTGIYVWRIQYSSQMSLAGSFY